MQYWRSPGAFVGQGKLNVGPSVINDEQNFRFCYQFVERIESNLNICFRPGCGMAEIWSLEDKANTDPTPTCAKLHRNEAPYFKRVFRNEVYDILKVLDTPAKR